MKKISILNSYDVFIGSGLLGKISKLLPVGNYSSIFLIIDEGFNKHWSKKIKKLFPKNGKIIIHSGEQNKNIDNVQKIWNKLLLSSCDRKTLVINLGGGVTSDIGGFAASTYMRGIDFLQIPTTLLAQVDASIGGKVGINFLGIKNLIGTFQQPVCVIIDIDTLSALPRREFISGFAEVIKHGLIADKKYFQIVTAKKPKDFSRKELIEIITGSVRIKARFVSQDEKESGFRKLLNFGHTIGHAVEALSQETTNPLLHGEAVSIGMVAEGKISNLLGLLSDEECKQVEKAMIQAGLPTRVPDLAVNEILERIKSDKKNIKGETKFTLLAGIGKAVYNQQLDEEIIRKVI